MAPPPPPLPSNTVLFVGLILRLISLVAMVISVGVLGSNTITIETRNSYFSYRAKFSFKEIYAYRYASN